MKYTLFLFPLLAFGQQPLPSSSQFAAAAQVLRGTSPKPPKAKAPAMIQATITRDDEVALHREFLSLPDAAQKAIDLSREWSIQDAPPVIGKDGRVLYAYGEGLPVIPTALLQSTELDLEPGEEIAADGLDVGDNRFEVAPRKTGTGAQAMPYLVIKPKAAGLDTTMVIGTNRRPYYVRLVSTKNDYVNRVAFTYPQDEQKRKLAEADAEHVKREQDQKQDEVLAKANTMGPVKNTDYEVKPKGKSAAYLKPTSVWDDGAHTFIQLTAAAKRQGLPVPQIRDAKGPMSPNYRWSDDRLIVDALFEHACLVAGVGSHQQKVCITNHGLPNGAAH